MSGAPCGEFPELASSYADERLEGADLLRLERHLEACAACRDFEGGVRRLRGLLQAGEAIRPLRRPPAGFAAAVMARVAADARGTRIEFPGAARPAIAPHPGRRASAWIAFAAAAAAAAVFFAVGWQRLLPAPSEGLEAGRGAAPAAVAALEEGSMEEYLSRHTLLARGATLLGRAEEVEFATFSAAPADR